MERAGGRVGADGLDRQWEDNLSLVTSSPPIFGTFLPI